jgi:hypothetical protein
MEEASSVSAWRNAFSTFSVAVGSGFGSERKSRKFERGAVVDMGLVKVEGKEFEGRGVKQGVKREVKRVTKRERLATYMLNLKSD